MEEEGAVAVLVVVEVVVVGVIVVEVVVDVDVGGFCRQLCFLCNALTLVVNPQAPHLNSDHLLPEALGQDSLTWRLSVPRKEFLS